MTLAGIEPATFRSLTQHTFLVILVKFLFLSFVAVFSCPLTFPVTQHSQNPGYEPADVWCCSRTYWTKRNHICPNLGPFMFLFSYRRTYKGQGWNKGLECEKFKSFFEWIVRNVLLLATHVSCVCASSIYGNVVFVFASSQIIHVMNVVLKSYLYSWYAVITSAMKKRKDYHQLRDPLLHGAYTEILYDKWRGCKTVHFITSCDIMLKGSPICFCLVLQ